MDRREELAPFPTTTMVAEPAGEARRGRPLPLRRGRPALRRIDRRAPARRPGVRDKIRDCAGAASLPQLGHVRASRAPQPSQKRASTSGIPCGCVPSHATSPALIPMRTPIPATSVRRFADSIACWIATAAATASAEPGNDAMMPSPRSSWSVPRWAAIACASSPWCAWRYASARSSPSPARNVVEPTRSVKRIVAVPVCDAAGCEGIAAVYFVCPLRIKVRCGAGSDRTSGHPFNVGPPGRDPQLLPIPLLAAFTASDLRLLPA